MNLGKKVGAAQFSAIDREEEHMYKRIGLLTVVLAAFVMLSAGLAKAQLAAPGTADVGVAMTKTTPSASPAAANNQTAVACNVCFTCGGDWPVFAGAWNSANFAATERGSACSGALGTVMNDHDPFLCCR